MNSERIKLYAQEAQNCLEDIKHAKSSDEIAVKIIAAKIALEGIYYNLNKGEK